MRSGISALAVAVALGMLTNVASPQPTRDKLLPMVEKLARSPAESLIQRQTAIQALGSRRSPAVVPILRDLLADPLPEIRRSAAQALGWPGNHEAVSLLGALVQSPQEEETVRVAAIVALGATGLPEARGLVEALARSDHARIREAALTSLIAGALASPGDAIPHAIALLTDTSAREDFRADAARVFMERPDPRGFDPLLAVVAGPASTTALPAPDDLPDRDSEFQTMRYRLSNRSNVRAYAATALAAYQDARAVPVLMKTAADPNDYFLRLRSIYALRVIKAKEALPTFTAALRDGHAETRATALAAVAELGDASVRPAVEAVANSDPQPWVREAAKLVLSRLPE